MALRWKGSEPLGGEGLLEEMSDWEQALKFGSWGPLPVQSFLAIDVM